MAKSLLLIFTVLFIVEAALAQHPAIVYENNNQIDPKPWVLSSVSGEVKDTDDVPIPDVVLGIFKENEEKLIASQKSDKDGKYAFELIPAGKYRLVVKYIPFCTANVPFEIVEKKTSSKGKKLVIYMKSAGIDSCSYAVLKQGRTEKENLFSKGQNAETKIRTQANEYFGKPVQGFPDYYNLGDKYVIKLSFDEKARLEKIAVYPISAFSEMAVPIPREESIPPISDEKFAQLLTKISNISPIGNVESQSTSGFSSAGKTSFWDKYSNAYIERVKKDTYQDPNARIYGFEVKYLLSHSEAITDKRIFIIGPTESRYVIFADRKKYLVDKKDFETINAKSLATFRGVLYE